MSTNTNPFAATATSLKSLLVLGKPLVFTNVHSVASAKLISALPGTKALTTGSYSVAHEHGVEDDDLTFEDNIASVTAIARVGKEAGLPVAADFRDGYGERLEEGIRKLIKAGIVGCNLEDYFTEEKRFYSVEEAAARVKKVIAVAVEEGVPDFVLNARTDVLVHGGTVEDAIARGKAYLDAGASTVFVWGGSKRGVRDAEVKELVDAFGGKLNVLYKAEGLSVKEIAGLGVARISMGPWLQIVGERAIKEEALRILEEVKSLD